jgi:hypothetical protein
MITAIGSFSGEVVFAGTSNGKMYRVDVRTGDSEEQRIVLPEPSPSTTMAGGAFTRIVGSSDSKMFACLVQATEEKKSGAGYSPPISAPVEQSYVLRLDGDTWVTPPGIGLPGELMYGLVVVAAPGTRVPYGLLCSTDDAVYISRDDGQTWQRASRGLPRRPHCGDLRFVVDRSGAMTIHLGTYGRSVWSVLLKQGMGNRLE